jgi:hypothetical protein
MLTGWIWWVFSRVTALHCHFLLFGCFVLTQKQNRTQIQWRKWRERGFFPYIYIYKEPLILLRKGITMCRANCRSAMQGSTISFVERPKWLSDRSFPSPSSRREGPWWSTVTASLHSVQV